jgi:hypothetical protein
MAYGNLGCAYRSLGDHSKAIEYTHAQVVDNSPFIKKSHVMRLKKNSTNNFLAM